MSNIKNKTMEEKKIKKLNTAKGQKEPTVEDYKNYCDQLLQQRNQIALQLKEATNVLSKLPILFEVIKYREVFPEEFTKACVNEVMAIMLPPVEAEKKDGDQNPKD